jgi:hypothetical protein
MLLAAAAKPDDPTMLSSCPTRQEPVLAAEKKQAAASGHMNHDSLRLFLELSKRLSRRRRAVTFVSTARNTQAPLRPAGAVGAAPRCGTVVAIWDRGTSRRRRFHHRRPAREGRAAQERVRRPRWLAT